MVMSLLKLICVNIANFAIDTVQIQFGACQKWKSLTIEVLLTFYYCNETLPTYSCLTYTKLHVHIVNWQH